MKISIRSFTLVLLVAAALAACGGGDSDSPMSGPPLLVDAEGNSTFDSTTLGSSLTALPIESLSAAESASLVFMR